MNYEHWRYYARGWLLHFFGKDEGAYAAYVLAYAADPKDVASARALAGIAADKSKWEAAEAWFEKVLELQPEDSDIWFNLGFVREHAGKSEAALAAFDAALRFKPTQDRAWYGKGRAHARLGQHGMAVDAFAEAVKLQPMNGEAYYQWGMALHHANRPDEIVEVVKKLVGFEPKRAKRLVQDAERVLNGRPRRRETRRRHDGMTKKNRLASSRLKRGDSRSPLSSSKFLSVSDRWCRFRFPGSGNGHGRPVPGLPCSAPGKSAFR
jgi:tetratricopeptide (TPR) repeat protein